MTQKAQCPFVYATGKRCKGEVFSVWRKDFHTGEFETWTVENGKLVGDPDVLLGYQGGTSHFHIECSLKEGHAGFMPDDPRMKFDTLSELKEAIFT